MKAEMIFPETGQKAEVFQDDKLTIDIHLDVGPQGPKGERGDQGDPGDDYVLTPEDKAEIAGMVIDDTAGDGETGKTWSADKLVDALNEAGKVQDVQINGTSVVTDGVANVPAASSSALGVVKVNGAGLVMFQGQQLIIAKATNAEVKAGVHNYDPIVPSQQHQSAFYGLAKIAGHDEKDSTLPAGQYTEEAKAAIQQMLDVPAKADIPEVPVQDVQVAGQSVVVDGVANVPKASTSAFGVMTIDGGGPFVFGTGANVGKLRVNTPSDDHVKSGNQNRILPLNKQHLSAFYGLAKAAGDATQSASSNAVGNYTESAKSAISEMLNGSVSVSGTTPTINALPGVRYVCGEVSTIDINTPETGMVDVVFKSGSTPAVLTVTPPTGMTMQWANGFDPASLEADTVYEINIMDGCLGVAGTWS